MRFEIAKSTAQSRQDGVSPASGPKRDIGIAVHHPVVQDASKKNLDTGKAQHVIGDPEGRNAPATDEIFRTQHAVFHIDQPIAFAIRQIDRINTRIGQLVCADRSLITRGEHGKARHRIGALVHLTKAFGRRSTKEIGGLAILDRLTQGIRRLISFHENIAVITRPADKTFLHRVGGQNIRARPAKNARARGNGLRAGDAVAQVIGSPHKTIVTQAAGIKGKMRTDLETVVPVGADDIGAVHRGAIRTRQLARRVILPDTRPISRIGIHHDTIGQGDRGISGKQFRKCYSRSAPQQIVIRQPVEQQIPRIPVGPETVGIIT